MATTIAPRLAASHAVAAAPDPAEQLATLAREIKTLEARQAELTAEASRVAAALEAARDEQGRQVWAGSGAAARDATSAQVRELLERKESLSRACALGAENLAQTKREHLELELLDAERELSRARAAMSGATSAVDAAVRAFSLGPLGEVLQMYFTARAAAGNAWGRKYGLDRQAGRTQEHPMQNPGTDQLGGFPDLRDVVEEIGKYAAGRTAGQSMARIGEAHRDAMRFALDPRRQEAEAANDPTLRGRG